LQFDKNTVWFITENANKFREARSILGPKGILIRQLRQAKVELQDASLERIARFAVETASVNRPGLLLVEDSGLFIEALGGFPGPFSSYVYETIGLKGILGLLAGRKRGAYFQSSIAVASAKLPPRVFTGIVRGSVSRKIIGTSGFGYDPIFVPDGFKETFGQYDEDFKNRNSHRARAFLKFGKWYKRSWIGKSSVRTQKRALK
jgi:XTP/dITP diphosphohydrolase